MNWKFVLTHLVNNSGNILSIKSAITDFIPKQPLIATVLLHQLQAFIEIYTTSDVDKIDLLLLNHKPAPEDFDLVRRKITFLFWGIEEKMFYFPLQSLPVGFQKINYNSPHIANPINNNFFRLAAIKLMEKIDIILS